MKAAMYAFSVGFTAVLCRVGVRWRMSSECRTAARPERVRGGLATDWF